MYQKSVIHGLLVKSDQSDWLRIQNKYTAHALVKMTVQLHTGYNLQGQVVKMIFFSPWFMSPFLNFQDFGASERGKKPVQAAKGQPVVSRDQKENPDVHVWEEDDVDSVKVITAVLMGRIKIVCSCSGIMFKI